MQSDGSYPSSDKNHWVFVVLCQFLREIWYFFSGLVHKVRKCCCGPKVAPGPSTSLTATKRVCLIRHGQGAHNASIKNWKLIDPPLNEVGLAQAAKLCETLKAGGSAMWTVVSDQRLKEVVATFDLGAGELLKLSPLRTDPDFTFNLEDNEGVSDFFLDLDPGLGASW